MKTAACLRFAAMPWLSVLLAFASLSSPKASLCQSAPASSGASDSYASEALIIENLETTFLYRQDGTGVKESSVRMKIQNEAGARQFSVLSLPFAAASEKPQFESISVHHADGTTTQTPASDAMEVAAPVTQEAPLYSDLKTLQIPVRSLRAGDVLDYRIRVERTNPEAPNQFWGNYAFTKNYVVLHETLTLDVPQGKYVQQWSQSLQPVARVSAGHQLYVWTTSQLKSTAKAKKTDEDTTTPDDVRPDVAWSTFHSWAEVGEWYRSLSAPRAIPNDAIRAQADEITRGLTSPQEQLQALYNFVSSHIRYVGIDFGVGRYQPHAAAEVLANRYGDCKDKDTLFEALLKAKGFSSSPALIGVHLELIQDLPSPGFFNHVITAIDLPSGRVWSDTTPGVAAFRVLLPLLRDKPALLIPAKGDAAVTRTPSELPFPFQDRFEATATLDKNGELNGKVDISYRSDNEIMVRAIATNLAPAQWDQGTQFLANALGFSGTTSNSRFDHPEDTAQPMHVSYDYQKKPFGDWDNFRIIPLFPLNPLPTAPSKLPSKELDLGTPRSETAVTRIHLPQGFGADLPNAIHVKTPFATFDKTYKFESGDLIVQRQIVVLQQKVPAKSWEEYKKFADDISLGTEAWIQLNSNTSVGSGHQPPRPGENNPEAATLIAAANDLERQRKWPETLAKLDEAKKINPEQPFLWSNYGWVAMMRNQQEEAETAFRHEIEHHPEETYVVTMYANYLVQHGKATEAKDVLQSCFDRDPGDPQVAIMLATLEDRQHPDQAIAILRKADAAKADDPTIQLNLADRLIRNQGKAEAAAIAHKMLDAAGNDPDRINNATYLLAEADTDLPLAEQNSRKSIALLEEQTATAGVSEANRQSFQRSSLLVASWDTLGYILLKQKQIGPALDYLESSWRNRPDSIVGLHYGEALEAAGRPGEALRIYELSLPPIRKPSDREMEIDALNAGIARLKAAKVASDTKAFPGTPQDLRTFTTGLKSTCKSFESSVFRMQLQAGAAPEILHVSGAQSQEFAELLKAVKLPHLVPSASKGKILRDVVMTCSQGKATAYGVMMPLGTIEAENIGN